jgi:dihydroflavonol-4-reductase
VFHVAGNTSWYRGDGAALFRTHVDGTRAVVEAMKRAGVPRGVFTSTVSAVGLTDDPARPADETTPHNWPRGFHYPHSKRQAEEVWFGAGEPGMTMVAVNPATVLGPGDARMGIGVVFKKIQTKKFPALARGGFSACDVRDVARGHLLAFEHGQRGQRYILGGVNLSYLEALERIAQALGAAVPSRQLSPGLVRVICSVVSGIEWLGFRIDVAAAFFWCLSRYVYHSTERARRELGYAPRPFGDTLADSVAWYRRQKLL